MSYRFMRVMIFFDLPMETAIQKREYTRFRKFLIKNGFLMLQKSVYCKLALNQTVSESILESVRKNKPHEGLIQVITITERQFSKMEFIIGEFHSDVLNTDERLIIL